MVFRIPDRPAKWRVHIRLPDGSRRTKTFDRKEDAMQFESEQRVQKQKGKFGAKGSGISFFEYSKHYLQKTTKSLVSSSWIPNESKLRRVWNPRIGHLKLTDIQLSDLNGVFSELSLFLSPATLNRHRALLHKMFSDAVKNGLVTVNPVEQITAHSEPRNRGNFWARTEDAFDYLEECEKRGEIYKIFFSTLLFSGMRVSEALPLTWNDINFETRIITISKIVERVSSKVMQRTKGEGAGSVAYTVLFPELYRILEKWKKKIRGKKDDALFLVNGKVFTYDHVEAIHTRAVKTSGVPRITIHGLRKTFAQLAKKQGLSGLEIKELLHHKNMTTTQRYVDENLGHLVEKSRKINFASAFVWHTGGTQNA